MSATFDVESPTSPAYDENGKKENRRANQAFQDYARMGTARSLIKLTRLYSEHTSEVHQTNPTVSINTLRKWCIRFSWVARSERFDQIEQERERAAYESRRAEIMEKGLALTHERVKVLSDMVNVLLEDFKTPEKVWLPDVKGIGSAENFQVVDLIKFNAGLVGEIRGILDDLAAETGGRVKKTENSGAIQLVQITSDDMANARKTAEDYERDLFNDGSAE